MASVLCAVFLGLTVVLLHGCGSKSKPKSATSKWWDQMQHPQPVIGSDGTIIVGAGHVYSLDGQDGSMRWRSKNDDFYWTNSILQTDRDGTIFVLDPSDQIYSLNGQTGALEWQTNISSASTLMFPTADLQMSDNTVFVGGSGTIHAFNKKNGSLKWRFETEHDSIFFTHSADDTVLGFSNRGMIALHGQDGTLKWNYSHDSGHSGIAGQPARDVDGILYFTTSVEVTNKALVMAMREDDGSVKWNYSTMSDVDDCCRSGVSHPTVALGKDGLVYAAGLGVDNEEGTLFHGHIWALQDGSMIWNFNTTKTGYCETPVLDTDGTVFVKCDLEESQSPCASGNLYAFDGRTGAMKWQSDCSQIIESVPVLSSDGTLYVVGSQREHIYALNTADGSVKWIFTPGGSLPLLSLVLAPDGTVITWSADIIYALEGEGRPVLPWNQRQTHFARESLVVGFDTQII